TREIGEPNPAGVTGGASVWLTWTPTTTHTVTINTHGSNFDTVLAVYTGSSVMGLTTVAANDDDVANRTLTSAVTFTAVAGTVYHIAVDGYHGATGSIVLNLA
ncbi:MAG: serine protease, partial [Planctomycetota bacterium]